jgi:diguanylate cyclase (GGDEF)-like protein
VHGLDVVHGRYIWQGWLVGDLIQMVVLTPPLLHLAGARVRRWVDRQFPVPPRHTVRYGKTVGIVVGIVLVVSALALQGTRMAIASLGIPPNGVTAGGEPLLPHLREIGWFLALLLAVVIVTISMLAAALARIGERERHVARRDQLTGAFNRRAFYDLYQKEADRSRRLGRGISLIQVDVDHFKRVNDRFGHEAGDEVLRQLVRRTQTVMREHDLLFRWGGEEFLVLLPHTGPDDAAQLAERIRTVVADEPFGRYDGTPPIPLTVSLGAVGASAPPDPDELIGLADVACYLAKEQGRNRVVSDTRDVELDGRLFG